MTNIKWDDIDIGDILTDFMPQYQRRIHYLVVDKSRGMLAISVHGVQETSFFVLQPLDSDNDWEVRLTYFDIHRPYATWRKQA